MVVAAIQQLAHLFFDYSATVFERSDKPKALLGCICNAPTGPLTLTQTCPNPTTYSTEFFTAVNGHSISVARPINFGGINFIQVFYDRSQGVKSPHITLSGGVDTTLLGIIPVPIPRNCKHYTFPETLAHFAFYGATIDSMNLLFTNDSNRFLRKELASPP